MTKYFVLEETNIAKREWKMIEETDNIITAIFVYGKKPTGRVIGKIIDPMALKFIEKDK